MWEPLELHNLSESVEEQAAPTEIWSFLLLENFSLKRTYFYNLAENNRVF